MFETSLLFSEQTVLLFAARSNRLSIELSQPVRLRCFVKRHDHVLRYAVDDALVQLVGTATIANPLTHARVVDAFRAIQFVSCPAKSLEWITVSGFMAPLVRASSEYKKAPTDYDDYHKRKRQDSEGN